MAWVIKDTNINEYYRQRVGAMGWYGPSIDTARLYTNAEQAQRTIDVGDHHVSYPGGRNLVVKEVRMIEL